MKPIILFYFLFFFLIPKKIFSGCGGLTCSSTNGIYITPLSFTGTVTIGLMTAADSVDITISSYGSCALNTFTLTCNGLPVHSAVGNGAHTFRILQKEGNYHVEAWIGGAYLRTLDFTFVSSLVGLRKLTGVINSGINIFPNPAQSEVSISSESEIKEVSIYNSLGSQLGVYKINGFSTSIPLENYPSGVYFVRTATIGDKILIRKLIVR